MVQPAARASPPYMQNSAVVFRFNCLYTHDLVRKRKRWQDGFLCFHTFNKRVMVYDVCSNFVGDTHWRDAESMHDGDELELDGGLMVQVGEEVERKQQDLSELLGRRTGERRRLSPRNMGRASGSFIRPGGDVGRKKPKSIGSVLGVATKQSGGLVSDHIAQGAFKRPRGGERTRDDRRAESPVRLTQEQPGYLSSSKETERTRKPVENLRAQPIIGSLRGSGQSTLERMRAVQISKHTSHQTPHDGQEAERAQVVSQNQIRSIVKPPTQGSNDNPTYEETFPTRLENQSPVQLLTLTRRKRKRLICEDTSQLIELGTSARARCSSGKFQTQGHGNPAKQYPVDDQTFANSSVANVEQCVTVRECTMINENEWLDSDSKIQKSTDLEPQEVQTHNISRVSVLRPTNSDVPSTTESAGGLLTVAQDAVDIQSGEGPWSREAFDLFGWNEGEPKKIPHG